MSNYESSLTSLSKWLRKGDLPSAVAKCEQELAALPVGPFHAVIGRSWKRREVEAAKWLKKFYHESSKRLLVESLYCEMNRFEINTDRWYLDAFAYDYFGGSKDVSWLTDWKHSTSGDGQLVLKRMDDLQAAFRADFHKDEIEDDSASELATFVLTIRMLELVDGAAKYARSKGWLPENLPVICAAHDADPIHFSYGPVKPRVNRPRLDRPVITAGPPAIGWCGIYEIDGGWNKGNSLPWDLVKDIRADADGYFKESMEAQDVLRKTLNAAKPAARWTPTQVKIRKRDWRRDIYSFYPFWAVNERAKAALEPLLRKSVELLPLDVQAGPELWVIHPLRHIPLSDEAIFNHQPGFNMGTISKYAFAKSDLKGIHLFQIKLPKYSPSGAAGMGGREVFVSDEFKRVFVESNLSGIVFNEVFRYEEDMK